MEKEEYVLCCLLVSPWPIKAMTLIADATIKHEDYPKVTVGLQGCNERCFFSGICRGILSVVAVNSSSGGWFSQGQGESKAGSLVELTCHLDGALMIMHSCPDKGQAEAKSGLGAAAVPPEQPIPDVWQFTG